jgi:hypothetical protein
MTMRLGLRLTATAIVYLVFFVVSYGALIPGPASSSSTGDAPIAALVTVACLNTAVMGWLILRSRLHGWWLIATLIGVFFCVQTLLPQFESIIFQSFPGFASHLPAGMVPRIVAAGFVHAVLWIPLATIILGKHRPDPGGASPSERPALLTDLLSWKLPLAAAVYVVLYFTFGYYVAWRQPAITTYYGGTDPGTIWLQLQSVMRATPWLPLAQAFRGLLWATLAVVVGRMMKGSTVEKAIAIGLLFGVVMNAGLLLPNPYMPQDVRMIHLVETASSNFLFGVMLGWLFGRDVTARAPELSRNPIAESRSDRRPS